MRAPGARTRSPEKYEAEDVLDVHVFQPHGAAGRLVERVDSGKYGVGFDLDDQVRCEQAGHNHGSRGRPDFTKGLRMSPGNTLGVDHVGDVDDGAHHVRETGTGFSQCVADNPLSARGLFMGVAGIVGWLGAGAGHMNVLTHADGAGVPEGRLEGSAGRYVYAFHFLPYELGKTGSSSASR